MDNARRLLLELDALVDTRMGTLVKLDVDPKHIFRQDLVYWTRLSDDFEAITGGAVTFEQYQEAYKKRDVETLKSSLVTNIVDDLKSMTRHNVSLMNAGEQVSEVRVTLNYHPYDLSKTEVEGYIDAIKHYVSFETIVDAVSIPPELLHLDTMAMRWDCYLMYNFRDWVATHEKNLANMACPEFEMIVPAFWYSGKNPDGDAIKGMIDNKLDPMSALGLAFAGTAKVRPQPIAAYSAIHPLGVDGIIEKLNGPQGAGVSETKSS